MDVSWKTSSSLKFALDLIMLPDGSALSGSKLFGWMTQMKNMKNQVWDKVSVQVSEQTWDQVGIQARNQVKVQVSNQVMDQVMYRVRVQVWNELHK